MEDSLFRAYVPVISQFAVAPKAECQRLIRCDPRFTIEYQGVVRQLGFFILTHTCCVFTTFDLCGVRTNVNIVMFGRWTFACRVVVFAVHVFLPSLIHPANLPTAPMRPLLLARKRLLSEVQGILS